MAGLRLRAGATSSLAAADADPIEHDFDDPYLELVRLLHEAAQLEHALMAQYLYAAFSLKPAYASLRGQAVGTSTSVLGVAIQEMSHLHQVNLMLVGLGAAPSLQSEGFPYEPQIYPFPLELEPMSRTSLARYVFAEAPGAALDPANPDVDPVFVADVLAELQMEPAFNHVGSFYQSILGVLGRVEQAPPSSLPDIAWMRPALVQIKANGEDDHFRFFKDVFTGTHPGMGGHSGAWKLDPDGADYPALALPHKSAYRGQPGALEDGVGRDLAWLSNLHYWAVLAYLDLSYRYDDRDAFDLAKRHMREAMFRLAPLAARMGVGLPFDPLALGSSPGAGEAANRAVVGHLLAEAKTRAEAVRAHLPANFPFDLYDEATG